MEGASPHVSRCAVDCIDGPTCTRKINVSAIGIITMQQARVYTGRIKHQVSGLENIAQLDREN